MESDFQHNLISQHRRRKNMADSMISPNMKFAIFEGTMPSDTSAYRQRVPFVANSGSNITYCIGMSARHANGSWYGLAGDSFQGGPFMNGADLRFTLTSMVASSYGGQPFKALIAYSH